MVKVIYADKKYDAEARLGQFLDETDFDVMVDFDCDLYAPSLDGSMTEENIVAKFRKKWFSPREQQQAYEGLREAAVESQNRGLAAGPRGEILGAAGRDFHPRKSHVASGVDADARHGRCTRDSAYRPGSLTSSWPRFRCAGAL